MLVQRTSNEPKKQELGTDQKESVTREQNLTNKDQDLNFLRAEDSTKGCTYRTKRGLLVKVHGFNREDKRVILIPDTGSEVPVEYDYPLYYDLDNPLVAQRRLEFGETEGQDGYGYRKERKRKETKTSCVDSLLREGKELAEVVKIISEKYGEEEKKVKRLVWSRRAKLKGENGN